MSDASCTVMGIELSKDEKLTQSKGSRRSEQVKMESLDMGSKVIPSKEEEPFNPDTDTRERSDTGRESTQSK